MEKKSLPLSGISILNTRPKNSTKKTEKFLESLGANIISEPTIEIKPVIPLKANTKSDIFIFVSENAVVYSKDLFKNIRLTNKQKLIAIGKNTKLALENQFNHPVIVPPIANSESLLKLNCLHNIKNKKITLVTGIGGRALINRKLTQRGACVEKLAVYKRTMPLVSKLDTIIESQKIDYILTTSNNALKNLLKLNDYSNWPLIKRNKLVVVSQRMAKFAKRIGFSNILISNGASNQAISETIMNDNVQNNPEASESDTQTKSWPFRVLVLLIFISLLTSGYLFIKQIKNDLVKNQLTSNIQNNIAKIEQSQIHLLTNIQQLQQQQLDFEKQIARLSMNEPNALKWRMLSAKNMLELAYLKINYEYNSDVAIELLGQLINNYQQYSLPPKVHASLAEDLKMITTKKFDIQAIKNQIKNFENILKFLPNLAARSNKKFPEKTTSDSVWQSSIYRLSDFIRIKHNEHKVEPLLSKESQANLIIAMRLMLLEAEHALLTRDNNLYQAKLKQLKSWLKIYFDTDSQILKNRIKIIDQLLSVNIKHQQINLQSLAIINMELAAIKSQDQTTPADKT